jgi:hypothetical protein
MAKVNKIVQHNLEDRVLVLAGEGKSSALIAQIITAELNGADTISQPTVSRWLKTTREERSNQTKQIVHDHIKATVPEDLKALDEVEGFMLALFRNKGIDEKTGEEIKTTHDLRTQIECGMKAVKIIETKLRFAGILDDPEKSGSRVDPVDLEQFKNDLQDLKDSVDG